MKNLLPALPSPTRVYAYPKPVSMTYGFPKLSKLVEDDFGSTFDRSKVMYLFVNKKYTYLKILFYSEGGLCMISKKLDPGGHFMELPRTGHISIEFLAKVVNSVVFNGNGKKLKGK